MTKYFVWLIGLRGPEAQIWHDQPPTGEGKSRVSPIFQQELTDEEEKLSLDQLILKFKEKAGEE